MKITQQELSVKYSENSKIYPDSLRLRLYRALSWLEQAEKRQDDLDFCFISLWISFNAIYADDLNEIGDRR
ncbi:hypothetical protein DWQ65_09475 [Treponema phagedenis]|uniref:HEPN domain-containing protein n=1 Tax=Treponema phagedenis TaxID=162 RepID=UPI0001F63884|nr:HEPN domain-containing protein [Treponema phagedenis]EFW36655.1 hypothetical protein HMPREF9554_02868 [Treponema phagedenis F0421]QSI00283.1 hypothetical protein DWQ65_09475 [Treponema phagedenis]TYT78945.1 hypothetical protein FS559_07395 [Treponema phagedenis]